MKRSRPGRPASSRAGLLLLALASVLPVACITRDVKDTIVERRDVIVALREHKKGFEVIPRGFQHPARIAPQRLQNILGAIDVRGRETDLAGLRAAFDPAQVPVAAEALAEGLSKANPNQEVAVTLIRKEMQHVIFDRKRLTSFVAYVQDGLLYLYFSRIDWEIPDLVKKTSLPEPQVDEHPMKFKVIPVEGMYSESSYAVSVDWQDPIFQNPLPRTVAGEGDRRERTILMEAPERAAPRRSSLPADLLPYLTPDQLRELADLEEARQNGGMTEGRYRREREKILDEARASATSE